jgi:hypothetical protein
MLEDKIVGKRPGGGEFEDTRSALHAQADHRLQGIHPPAPAGDDQKLRFFRACIQVVRGFFKKAPAAAELLVKDPVVG